MTKEKIGDCEIRAGNNLCMLPGSVVNGNHYKTKYHVPVAELTERKENIIREWITKANQPKEEKKQKKSAEIITPADVSRDMQIVKLMLNVWEESTRQDTTLALAGFLKRHNYSEGNTLYIVECICKNAKDNEILQRLAAVKATYSKDKKATPGTRLIASLSFCSAVLKSKRTKN